MPVIHSGKRRTTFRRFAIECQSRIQEALFQHRWQEAAELLKNYFQSLEDMTTKQRRCAPEVIWRMGTEILLHHPNSSDEDINSFFDKMNNIGMKQYLKVCLEHSFHLLCNGKVEEAHRCLTLAESWRYGEKSALQQERIKLIQAYRALLDYCTWFKKRAMLSQEDLEDCTNSAVAQDMHNYFRQALVNLQEIVKSPGVWDPFVLSCVDMLEFYEDHDGALKVLKFYANSSTFLPNPNAYVYLYEFLKRHQAQEKQMIKVLQTLYRHVPSHQLMLEFIELLERSKKQKHHKLGLTVSFTLLDYSSWKDNPKLWKRLVKQMKKAIKDQHSDWIQKQWELRMGWWLEFHFSAYQAKKNFLEEKSLAYKKALVAGVLLGKGSRYFRSVYTKGKKIQKAKPQKMRKFVERHSFVQCG